MYYNYVLINYANSLVIRKRTTKRLICFFEIGRNFKHVYNLHDKCN